MPAMLSSAKRIAGMARSTPRQDARGSRSQTTGP